MTAMRKAGFLIIGNEILSGGTAEKNLPVLSGLLRRRGWHLSEARIVRDEKKDIIAALDDLRRRMEYVFTSGGIGPTHDDITTAAVAAGLGLAVAENASIAARLRSLSAGAELSAARRKMAHIPVGAAVLESDYPGPPGYCIDNIFVCAGVPSIFRQMAMAAVGRLPLAPPLLERSLRVAAAESVFAAGLAQVQQEHGGVEIGSYPGDTASMPCRVHFSGTEERALAAAAADFAQYLRAQNIAYSEQ